MNKFFLIIIGLPIAILLLMSFTITVPLFYGIALIFGEKEPFKYSRNIHRELFNELCFGVKSTWKGS